MPTYVCTAAANRLSPDQKQSIAHHLTTIHSQETGAPPFVVQVFFHEVQEGSHFINGMLASSDQIWIRADIRGGRTIEQKTKMIDRIMNSASEATGISSSYIWVYVCDIAKAAEFGSLMPSPGAEAEWAAALPADVKQRYNF